MPKIMLTAGLFSALLLFFTACGGGGGETSSSASSNETSSVISSSTSSLSSSSSSEDSNDPCPNFAENETNCYLSYVMLNDNEKACCDVWLETQE